MFEVKEDGPWLGLVRPSLSYKTHYQLSLLEVTQRLQGWRNTIATKACDVVDKWIKGPCKEEFAKIISQTEDGIMMKELIAEQIEAQFQKVSVGGESELYTYAYQWAEWNDGIEKKVS